MSGVNDFAIKIGTVNGTGSASANGLLMQSIFRMGIPVSGKNIFPSNIQGLPTWYEIRVNADGHTARTPDFDLLVAMNSATYARDIAEVRRGGYLLHDSTWPLAAELHRDDIHFIGIPIAAMCNEEFAGSRVRILMKNIVYVGALVALLEIDPEIVKGLLQSRFGAKPKLMDANYSAIKLGYDYARDHYDTPLPVHLEQSGVEDDSILIDGNTAAALGCLYAGATVAAWYPITPSTSLVDAFSRYCERYRKDPETGENLFCIIQAEDELAAAGMVIGASWSGARAFTATSGPGISLMGEFIGLAYYTEIPTVIFNVQRTGPSTGMPTRTQQGDLLALAYASHGDTRHILLFPADPAECFTMAVEAFDLAERFQTPVFVVSDLDIGMNDWVIPRLEWDDSYRPDRGKVLGAEELEEIEQFYRYLDVDGDGIPYRTLPGVHPKGAYFTRGSGHDQFGRYTEDSEAYTQVVDRLNRKIAGAAVRLPQPDVVRRPGARMAIVSVGSCHPAVLEALEVLSERGIELDYMRIRGFPFPESVERFIEEHDRNFVVEQNRDGQLQSMLTLETSVPRERLASVRYYGGQPLSAHHVVTGITELLEGEGSVAAYGEDAVAAAAEAGGIEGRLGGVEV